MSNSVDETIQEMKKFIEECNKAQVELDKELGLKLTELIKRLDDFRNINTVYGQAAREVISKK